MLPSLRQSVLFNLEVTQNNALIRTAVTDFAVANQITATNLMFSFRVSKLKLITDLFIIIISPLSTLSSSLIRRKKNAYKISIYLFILDVAEKGNSLFLLTKKS